MQPAVIGTTAAAHICRDVGARSSVAEMRLSSPEVRRKRAKAKRYSSLHSNEYTPSKGAPLDSRRTSRFAFRAVTALQHHQPHINLPQLPYSRPFLCLLTTTNLSKEEHLRRLVERTRALGVVRFMTRGIRWGSVSSGNKNADTRSKRSARTLNASEAETREWAGHGSLLERGG